jgi:hypothetical protein
MRKIWLSPPVVEGQEVFFEWSIQPTCPLYVKTNFSITFPPSVDLTRVPPRLWWDIFLLCLHPHWLLLRPCEISMPLRLGEPLRQFWLQLLQNGFDTLEAYSSPKKKQNLDIKITDGDLVVPYERASGRGYGTAFSGGKDSLLQSALLFEIINRPLLVATSSPMPPLADHVTMRRRQIFKQIQVRANPVFVETSSDLRSTWDNSFASQLGYRIAVNELTDTFLYTASLVATGAALGFTHLFVASEAELQESAVLDGKIVQHSHFMYTAATQRAIARILTPYGIQFGSLTWPLHTMQVQQLLWSRYPGLSDLQYSCWRVGANESTCSECEQCLRIAVTALEGGYDPQRMGIDLRKIINFASSWVPIAERPSAKPLPQDDAADELAARVVDAMRSTSLIHLGVTLARVSISDLLHSVRKFKYARERVGYLPKPPQMGIRNGFLDWIDADLREPLTAIYTKHFPIEQRHTYVGHLERSDTLTRRATVWLDR